MADMAIRHDKAPIKVGATPVEVRANGAKVYEGTAAFGDIVKRYPDLDPPRNEFIPADEAMSPAALASLRGAVFTAGPRARDWDGRVTLPADHPSDLTTPDTAADLIEGTVLDAWRIDPPAAASGRPELKVRVIAYTRAVQDLIEAGVHELSLGMSTAEDWTSGVADGVPYQVIQRRVVYDHLNLVERARSRAPDGRAARLDADAEAAAKPSYPRPGEKPPMDPALLALFARVRTLKMDALSAEDAALFAQMTPEAQAALKTAAESIGAAAAEGAAMEAEVSGATDIASVLAELQALKADVAALKAMKTDAPMPAMDPKAKKDGSAVAVDPVATADRKDSAMLTNPDAVIAAAKSAASKAAVQSYNDAARFVGHVKKDGHPADTTDEAATVMLTVIKAHLLPSMVTHAEECIKGQRLDSLTLIYDQAEALRRADILRSQAEDVGSIVHRNDAAVEDTGTLPMFRIPARGRAGVTR